MRSLVRRALPPVVMVIGALVAACGGGGPAPATPGATVATTPGASAATAGGSGTCAWLTPADFTAVGITGAGTPTDNSQEAGSHYCVYNGLSGATGGIEFDAFTSASVDDAKATYETMMGEIGAGAGRVPAGAAFDAASFADDGKFAAITVQQGRLAFSISAPSSADAEAHLVALAKLVVQRAGDAVRP
jgi:hypothetical protein